MNIFKKLSLKLFCAVVLVASANANAGLIYDVVDPSPDVLITTTSPYTFTHDLTNNGFVLGTTSIVSAFLDIHLTDFLNKGNESFRFLIGSDGQIHECLQLNCVNHGSQGQFEHIDLSVGSIADLFVDGKITLTLTSLAGDYHFASSVLTAHVIPEPMMLALLGLGFLGLGAVRRRKQ